MKEVKKEFNYSKLFSSSSFFCLEKKSPLSPSLSEHGQRLVLPREIESFSATRKEEFILGRLCASEAYKMCLGEELLSLPRGDHREALWPSTVVGSLSHNEEMVGAAVAKCDQLLGVGIDFEVLGRTKLELSAQIRCEKDLKNHPDFSDRELLTIIFSAKESLYKALYPTVKTYFGFSSAAVLEIDSVKGTFVIELILAINQHFCPEGRCRFNGNFEVYTNNLLTVLEVQHS